MPTAIASEPEAVPSFDVSPADRLYLKAVVADRNSRQKYVWRAQIVLSTADGTDTAEVMRTAGVSKPAVWRWQERFVQKGVGGVLRDKTRRSPVPPLEAAVVERVVALSLEDPQGETTHWAAPAMAKVSGV